MTTVWRRLLRRVGTSDLLRQLTSLRFAMTRNDVCLRLVVDDERQMRGPAAIEPYAKAEEQIQHRRHGCRAGNENRDR